ncbi:MAG: tyrosine-type recombinase/integrase [Hyphomicrobiaceae bacterium]
MAKNLVRRHRRYWARMRVPADVREAFENKSEQWINLTTDDLKLAEARAQRANSDFRARVLEARGRVGTVDADALAWRSTIEQQAGGPDEDMTDVAYDAAVKAASEKYVRGGYKAVERAARLFHEGNEPTALIELGGPKAKAFVDIALVGHKPLRAFIVPWFAAREREVEKTTAFMDRRAVSAFAAACPLVTDVTKANVAKWIEGRRAEVTAATVQREVTGLRSLWQWLRAHGEVPDDAPDPFHGHKYQDRRKRVEEARREAFTPEEAARLYKAAMGRPDDGPTLGGFIALGAWTGARREEIASLRVEDVSLAGGRAGHWITIRGAKTSSGNRTIPAHPAIVPLLKRLIGKRTTGFLFADLEVDRFGRRSDLIGKKFTALKQRLGFPDEKTFHSLRHMFVQQVRAKGVPEDLVADLVGHKLASITGARYGTAEARRKLLPDAVAKLRYPKPL